jgi:hypothetical protein
MDLQKEITIIENKLKKIEDESYANELRSLSTEDLNFKLLQMAKHREEIITTRNEDAEYQAAKELVKEMSAPYNEQTRINKLKSRFIALLLKEERGV